MFLTFQYVCSVIMLKCDSKLYIFVVKLMMSEKKLVIVRLFDSFL